MNTVAITFFSANLAFTVTHISTSGMQSAATLHAPGLVMLTSLITDLLTRAHSTRGVSLRDAAQEAFLLFPTPVLGPHGPGASSSIVKTEVLAGLDLWRRGDLHELARLAKALHGQRPSAKRNKAARVARQAARLIRKKQFARTASLG